MKIRILSRQDLIEVSSNYLEMLLKQEINSKLRNMVKKELYKRNQSRFVYYIVFNLLMYYNSV